MSVLVVVCCRSFEYVCWRVLVVCRCLLFVCLLFVCSLFVWLWFVGCWLLDVGRWLLFVVCGLLFAVCISPFCCLWRVVFGV